MMYIVTLQTRVLKIQNTTGPATDEILSIIYCLIQIYITVPIPVQLVIPTTYYSEIFIISFNYF